jgi:hypothetical protein
MQFEKRICIAKNNFASFARLIATYVFGPLIRKLGIVFLKRLFGNPRRICKMALLFENGNSKAVALKWRI